MTALAVRESATDVVSCGDCGEPVLYRHTYDQRPVTLDAEPVQAGLYRFDEHNRAHRRALSDYVRESAGHGGPGGYELHACRGRPDWLER